MPVDHETYGELATLNVDDLPVSSVNGLTGAVVLDPTHVGAAAASHTHVIANVTGLQTALDAKNASVSIASNVLGTDVSMPSANTFYTGATLSLAAGTYILLAAISASRATTTATTYTARIRNATDNAVIVSSIQTMPSLNPHYLTISMMAPLTIASGPKTVNVDIAANQSNNTVRAAATVNGQGNNATYLVAIKIA